MTEAMSSPEPVGVTSLFSRWRSDPDSLTIVRHERAHPGSRFVHHRHFAAKVQNDVWLRDDSTQVHESERATDEELYAAAFAFAWESLGERANYRELVPTFGDVMFESIASSFARIISGCELSISPVDGEVNSTSLSRTHLHPFFPTISYLFIDTSDPYVVIRGGGFSMGVTGVLLMESHELHLFPCKTFFAQIGSPDWIRRFCDDWLAGSLDMSVPPTSTQVIFPDGTNLGHVLWNSASGLFLLQDLLRAWPDAQPDLTFALYRDPNDRFLVEPYLEQLRLADLHWDHSVARIEGPSINSEFHTMFLAGVVEPALGNHMVSLAAEASEPPMAVGPGEYVMLINVRTHSKRLLNAGDVFTEVLPRVQRTFGRPIKVVLECLTEDIEHVQTLVEALRLVGIAAVPRRDLGLIDLTRQCLASDVVIAPVGSGMVVPTWITGRPTIAHGNIGHLRQTSYWNSVSALSDPMSFAVIGAGDTIDEAGLLYSDYSISALGLFEAITRVLLSDREAP